VTLPVQAIFIFMLYKYTIMLRWMRSCISTIVTDACTPVFVSRPGPNSASVLAPHARRYSSLIAIANGLCGLVLPRASVISDAQFLLWRL
jgi:hypothetical protein